MSGRNHLLYEEYKTKLKKSASVYKRAKIEFESTLARNVKNDCKSFFSYIKTKQRSVVRTGPLKNSTGDIVIGDTESAELLNEYFSSVFTVEDVANIPNTVVEFSENYEALSSIEITESIVTRKLN